MSEGVVLGIILEGIVEDIVGFGFSTFVVRDVAVGVSGCLSTTVVLGVSDGFGVFFSAAEEIISLTFLENICCSPELLTIVSHTSQPFPVKFRFTNAGAIKAAAYYQKRVPEYFQRTYSRS